MLLVPEHTWGMDEKTYLGDHENYSNELFTAARGGVHFKKFESSWVEKRNNVYKAVHALEDTPLGLETHARLDAIRPLRPDLTAWNKTVKDNLTIKTGRLTAQFDPAVPALCTLENHETNFAGADAAIRWAR